MLEGSKSYTETRAPVQWLPDLDAIVYMCKCPLYDSYNHMHCFTVEHALYYCRSYRTSTPHIPDA